MFSLKLENHDFHCVENRDFHCVENRDFHCVDMGFYFYGIIL